MTTQNTNKTYFFDTKEEYLAFKQQWSDAVNSDKAKKYFVEKVHKSYYTGSKTIIRVKKHGWIKAVHHYIYNIVRNKPANHGFTSITNEKKLASGTVPDIAYQKAEWEFRQFQRFGKDSGYVQRIMAPFGDKIDLDKLLEFNK